MIECFKFTSQAHLAVVVVMLVFVPRKTNTKSILHENVMFRHREAIQQ